MIDQARECALSILLQMETEKAYSNLLLNQRLEKSGLDDRDRRFVTELVYGTIQRRYSLDWVLNQLVKKGIDSLEDWVKEALRLGLYQLMFLDKVPERAAVHSTVQLAKTRGHEGIARLVNGVLRSFLRQRSQFSLPQGKDIRSKAIRYSHPEWLIRRMEQVYGEETTAQMLEATLTPSSLSLRVNALKINRETFLQKWGEFSQGEVAPSMVSPNGVLLSHGGNPAKTEWFQDGFCTIQDQSSMLVADVLDPQPGMHILDACAAPGGKATHLAEKMDNQGVVIACDVQPHKLKLIQSNADRLGTSIIETTVMDSRTASQHFAPETFDAVLLDAPCSGLGVIQRKPEIKWNKDGNAIRELVHIQKELLEAVAALVKPGGVLVYSTCTLEPKENEEQIKMFLATHPGFSVDPNIKRYLTPKVRERAILGKGWMQILPHHFGSDGFFIARLVKKS